ncbi:MAG: PCMD domain-containing protein [Muribaculaceae bacterium]|nr:PCMD domain-containing protein [Muribaculaceae bacterium]
MRLRQYNAIWILMLSATLAALTGCIKNDIPYPRIQPDFLQIEAEGQTREAVIDVQNRFITLTLGEEVDIENVDITSYALSEGASIVGGDLDAPVNLKKYYIVTLRLYQDYDWVIQGVQNIERYFTVENQIGATVIDVVARRVVVTVPESQGLERVKVLTMKLGPTGSTVTPALAGATVSLEEPLEVTVSAYGRNEKWTIYGETVQSSVSTSGADAFTQVAWVYGAAVEGRDNGVEYRLKGAEDWIRVPSDWITHTGSTFSARLIHLNPETTYEARAYSGEEYGAIEEFTTGSIVQVPNSSLDHWSLSGRVWNPWGEGDEPYWDSGNKGATTLGDSNTTPTDTTSTGIGDGYAARLLTKFVGIGSIGKLAAGNIFTGSYVRTDGTNGVLSFGRPFTQRPTKLHGYWKYRCTDISHTNNEYTQLKGRPDTCAVWVALIDSPEPFEIRTNPSNRHLFDPEGSEVVAYGSIQSGESIPEYVPFEVELNYRSYSRVPRYIIIVGSASKYGDFFTGGNGSVLYLDDLQLLYDY